MTANILTTTGTAINALRMSSGRAALLVSSAGVNLALYLKEGTLLRRQVLKQYRWKPGRTRPEVKVTYHIDVVDGAPVKILDAVEVV